jgi:predicted HTH transcriptional regulator
MMYSEANRPAILSDMDYLDVKNLAQTGEGIFLEFKRTVPGEEKIAREITAFANTKGGMLLVGVDDDKTLVGIKGYQEEVFVLQKATREWCRPPVLIQIEVVQFGKRDLLVVKIPEAPQKPVYVTTERTSTAFIRDDEQSLAASAERILILENQQSDSGVTFQYGASEQRLFRYLNDNHRISVIKYAQLIDENRQKAGKILVNLVSAGILKLFTKNNIDYFSFSSKYES